MKLFLATLSLAGFWGLNLNASEGSHSSKLQKVLWRPTRVIVLPVATGPSSQEGALRISSEEPETLPSGPEGFDVFSNGDFVVGDGDRLVYFNSDGKFLSELHMRRFLDACQKLRFFISSSDTLEICSDHSGDQDEYSAISRTGDILGTPRILYPGLHEALYDNSHEKYDEAHNNWRVEIADVIPHESPVIIPPQTSPGRSILTMRRLAVDKNFLYLDIETSPEDSVDNVMRSVRKYNFNGEVIAKAPNLNSACYTLPEQNDGVVKMGVFYQMVILKNKVVIRSYDLN